MKNTKLIFSVIAFSTLLCLSTSASAQDWKLVGEFGWFGVGKAHELEKGHFYWVGEFSGTFFNDKGDGSLLDRSGVKCPAWYDIDTNNKKTKAGGYCIMTDLDGDQLVCNWENAGTPGPGNRSPGTFTYLSGTGKYKNAPFGTAYKFVGVTVVNWADGTVSGYSLWNK